MQGLMSNLLGDRSVKFMASRVRTLFILSEHDQIRRSELEFMHRIAADVHALQGTN